jgi:cation diffusion facilitator family transporter
MNRDRQIRRMLWAVLVLNLLVAGAKLIYGHLTHSLSMWADGFHSTFDGTSNIIGLVGLWLASLPPDEDHPYGHRKFETFASFGISVLLFLTCFHLLSDSFSRLSSPTMPEVTPLSFGIMLATMGVNWAVMRWEQRRGRELKSDLLTADALHTRSDLFTSVSVLVSLFAVAIGFRMLDPVVAVVIAGFIAKTGFEILREVSKVFSDSSRIDPRLIREIAMRIQGVKDCHEVRTRGSLNQIYVDFHIDVPSETTADKAHDLVHEVEGLLKKELPEVVDVVIHVEPH